MRSKVTFNAHLFFNCTYTLLFSRCSALSNNSAVIYCMAMSLYSITCYVFKSLFSSEIKFSSGKVALLADGAVVVQVCRHLSCSYSDTWKCSLVSRTRVVTPVFW